MMPYVHVNFIPGLWRQKQNSTETPFHQEMGLKFKEETSEVLHLKRGYV
jgi:hypothetical protein